MNGSVPIPKWYDLKYNKEKVEPLDIYKKEIQKDLDKLMKEEIEQNATTSEKERKDLRKKIEDFNDLMQNVDNDDFYS